MRKAQWASELLHLCFLIISNLSLYSLDYAEACNELAGPISTSLRPGNTAPFEEMLQRWRAVGNTASDLTGPRFEPQTSRSRDESVTARPILRNRHEARSKMSSAHYDVTIFVGIMLISNVLVRSLMLNQSKVFLAA